MATRISLDRIVQLRVPVVWHEAVAVTQEVAQKAGGTGTAGLDTCWLSVSGLVEVGPKSRDPFQSDPATETLQALLDVAQAPRELVTLLESHKSEGNLAIGGLANELNFFARPDSTGAVAALATRALDADFEAGQQAEFERLRADVAESPKPKEKKQKEGSRRPVPPLALAAGALGAAAVVAVLVGLTLGGDGDTTPAAPADAPEATVPAEAAQVAPAEGGITSRIESLVDKGLERLGLRAVQANAAPVEPEKPEVARKPASRRTAPAKLAVPTMPLFVVMPPAAVEPSADTDTLVDNSPLAVPDAAADADAPLQPPVLRWPQLPEEPGDVPVGMEHPYLELMINELGTVDKVRLRAPRSTFHDKMLVSAAKAWVFHPAQKNGQPVKYLMKVRIIHQ